jgi:putative aldouronate transport system permease protein
MIDNKNSFFFKLFSNIFLVLLCACCIIPIILVISISLTSEASIATNGYSIFPKEFSINAYKYIFSGSSSIYNSYFITTAVTVIGTLISVFITALIAYPLSRQDLKHRNLIAKYLFFTMLFNGGLVPFYILVTKYLMLKNTIWAMILPYTVSAWNVLLMRNFISSSLPFSVIESAKIDGAGEFGIFTQIVLPMSKAALATIGLFVTLAYWNDWWLALLFIDNRALMPLQYTLQSILMNIQVLTSSIQTKDLAQKIPSESARMALCVLAIGPIVLAYPFFQKFLVKGMVVGAVKG